MFVHWTAVEFCCGNHNSYHPRTLLGAVISMTKSSCIRFHPTGCIFMCSASSSSYHCFVFSASFNQWELKDGRIYSCHHGFGIMPVPPDFLLPHDRNTAIFTELYQIMKTLTATEEAAIRQITPLINIFSLSQRNIGAKGNIHCLWKKSKLNLILPKDCRWIVIKRRQGYGTMEKINLIFCFQ